MALDEDLSTRNRPKAGEGVSAECWYASGRLRAILANASAPVTRLKAIESFGVGERFAVSRQLSELARGGLVTAFPGKPKRFLLSVEARQASQWAGAPKPESTPERGFGGWAGELANAVATFCKVEVHDMLHGAGHLAAGARARLCAALHARGWSHDAIDHYYAMRPGSAERGVLVWTKLKVAQSILGGMFPIDDIQRAETAHALLKRGRLVGIENGVPIYDGEAPKPAAKVTPKPSRVAKVIPIGMGHAIRSRRRAAKANAAASAPPKDAA